MGKPIIFVSHFTEEASVARELASSLGSLCNNEFDFFVASPQALLRGGEEWERTIVEKIKSCEAMLLLMSQASMLRPWVNFESGIARGMEKMIIPCCILGLRREHLARPYSSFQSLQLDSFADFMTLAEQMGHLKWTCPQLIPHPVLIHADNRSNLTGDLPPIAECLRRVL